MIAQVKKKKWIEEDTFWLATVLEYLDLISTGRVSFEIKYLYPFSPLMNNHVTKGLILGRGFVSGPSSFAVKSLGLGGTRTKNSEFRFRGTRTKN